MRQVGSVASHRGVLSSLIITVIGAILVVSSLVWYPLIVGPSKVIGTIQVSFLEEIAYATLGFTLVGLTITFIGATSLLRKISHQSTSTGRFSNLSNIALALSDRRCAKVFVGASVIYGLLFALISSSVAFLPSTNFASLYGVGVPSVIPVLCCGDFGQMPQFVIYVTQQLAILVIPVNLILLFTVSWLVGLNAASVAYAYEHRPRLPGASWFGGLGAIIGLFTACPMCAGFSLLATLGLSGAASAALSLASLQGIFVLIGVPVLAGALFLNIRQIEVKCSFKESSNM